MSSLRTVLKLRLNQSKRSATSGPGREWDVADVIAELEQVLAASRCPHCGGGYSLDAPMSER